jgi:hypothetical protein
VNDSRILGVCILLASVILSAAVVWHAHQTVAHPGPEIGRYQFQPSTPPGVIWVIDTTTGNVNSK